MVETLTNLKIPYNVRSQIYSHLPLELILEYVPYFYRRLCNHHRDEVFMSDKVLSVRYNTYSSYTKELIVNLEDDLFITLTHNNLIKPAI